LHSLAASRCGNCTSMTLTMKGANCGCPLKNVRRSPGPSEPKSAAFSAAQGTAVRARAQVGQ
jgi:hypothetical protein